MRKINKLVIFEVKRMIASKLTLVYSVIYLISFIISALFFKSLGSEGSVLTVGNAQSFPIQHLQASFFFTGIFVAIYVSRISSQNRTNGVIKIPLTRSVSRKEYFVSRVCSIFLFCLFITFIMIILSYIVGMFYFGWGDQLVFHSFIANGLIGILVTFLSGAVFAFAYFGFGLIGLVISMYYDRIIESATIMGIFLMVGQYFELLPKIRQFTIFHQMLFFHMDIFNKPLLYNVKSFLIIVVYCVIFSYVGYKIFQKKDLFV